MKKITVLAASSCSLFLVPALAFAHPGHEADGFLLGFFHPVHLLYAVLAVGVIRSLAPKFEKAFRRLG